MTLENLTADSLGRRALLTGAGVATLAGLAAANGLPAAADSDTAAGGGNVINDTPVTSTLSSAALSGLNYRYLSFIDFTPESAASRTWGGQGVFTTDPSYLWASMDIPAGARVRDIEWYVYNATGSTYTAFGRLWKAGDGSLFGPLLDIPISSGAGIRAFRGTVPSANYGPFPMGCKIMLGIATSGTSNLQVNGARVGLSNGAGAQGMLGTPVRAYDSRTTGGRLSGGVTRTITLPSSVCPVGTTAVMANIIVVDPNADGFLRVWRGDLTTAPGTSGVNFLANETVANAQVVPVSAGRQFRVRASTGAHVVVDVSGTVG